MKQVEMWSASGNYLFCILGRNFIPPGVANDSLLPSPFSSMVIQNRYVLRASKITTSFNRCIFSSS